MSNPKRLSVRMPDIQSDDFHDVTLLCRVCGEPTGEIKTFRDSMIDPSLLDSEKKLRHGVCRSCMEWVEKGHTIFLAEPDNMTDERPPRSVILTLEGTGKLKKEARGMIISIPMDEFINRFPPVQ